MNQEINQLTPWEVAQIRACWARMRWAEKQAGGARMTKREWVEYVRVQDEARSTRREVMPGA